MKIVVIKNNLKDGLSTIGRIAGENPQLPILKNVLLETLENKIVLTATNLEIAIKFAVSGKVIENGSAAVPVGILSNIISSIPSERLNVESKKGVVEIKTDNYQAMVNSSPSDEFPLIPKIKNNENYLELESGALKEAISQVAAASQFSELRPELNCVFMEYSVDNLRMAATDSSRLAEKNLSGSQFSSTIPEPFNFLLPIPSSQELSRILSDEGKVRIYRDENQVLFKTEQWELFSRLLEGAFPDYKQIIPKKYGAEITVSREEFINSLKLSGIFSVKSNEIKIKILENKKALEISSSDQSVGENSYLLPARIEGSAKEICFNWKYLSDGLRAAKSEEIFFGVNDDNKPSIIKSPKDASYFYIVMPILKA
ncbi:MAG: DNA polymerase III subunit beta [bacterium]|nr:DNA polymerase III subunit beta [bacterium]